MPPVRSSWSLQAGASEPSVEPLARVPWARHVGLGRSLANRASSLSSIGIGIVQTLGRFASYCAKLHRRFFGSIAASGFNKKPKTGGRSQGDCRRMTWQFACLSARLLCGAGRHRGQMSFCSCPLQARTNPVRFGKRFSRNRVAQWSAMVAPPQQATFTATIPSLRMHGLHGNGQDLFDVRGRWKRGTD